MKTITVLFRHRADAETATDQLVQDLHIAPEAIALHATDGEAASDETAPVGEPGLWTALKDLFFVEEERQAFSESLRQGHVVITAEIDDAKIPLAMGLLKAAGAIDLKSRHQDDPDLLRHDEGHSEASAADIPSLGATDLGLTDLGVHAPQETQPVQTPPGRAGVAPPWA